MTDFENECGLEVLAKPLILFNIQWTFYLKKHYEKKNKKIIYWCIDCYVYLGLCDDINDKILVMSSRIRFNHYIKKAKELGKLKRNRNEKKAYQIRIRFPSITISN